MKLMHYWEVLKKEIISTARDKQIIILLVLGPVILTLLFGGVYMNSYVDDIPIAVLDEDGSALSRTIVQQFDESDRFIIRYHADSKEALEQMIHAKGAYMGLYIPKDFSKDISTLASSQILILVDGTNLVVGNNCYAAAAEIIQTVAAGTQMKILKAKGIIPQQVEKMALVFNFNDRVLYDPRMAYINYLLFGYTAVFFQQVMLSGIGISILKDRESLSEGNIIGKIMTKILACFFFAGLSSYAAVMVVHRIFHVPVRGIMPVSLLYFALFALAISCPAIILSSLVRDKLKHAQIAYMLSLPSFVTCGYVWPTDQMPGVFVGLVKVFWPLIYFARPFDEYLIKGNFSLQSLAGLMCYTLIWFPIAIIVLKSSLRRGTKAFLAES